MGKLKGTLTSLFLVANTTWHCAILYILAIIRLPFTGRARVWLDTRMDHWVIDPWVTANRFWFRWLRLCEVQVTRVDELGLGRDRWYMVVSNHQSWTDIVLLQTLLRADLPPVKFFTKQQLLWVPLIGLAMHLLGFPYVRRVSREERERNPELANADRESTLAACDGFRTHPTAVLNFLEGTRFTREKHLRQAHPAYCNLLNPRIGGLGYVLQGLSSELHCLVDVTIDYPDGIPTFWQFLKGECRAVEIRLETRAIPAAAADPERSRDAVGDWVRSIWEAKDRRIAGSREPLVR